MHDRLIAVKYDTYGVWEAKRAEPSGGAAEMKKEAVQVKIWTEDRKGSAWGAGKNLLGGEDPNAPGDFSGLAKDLARQKGI